MKVGDVYVTRGNMKQPQYIGMREITEINDDHVHYVVYRFDAKKVSVDRYTKVTGYVMTRKEFENNAVFIADNIKDSLKKVALLLL
jgi:hypothetical protein